MRVEERGTKFFIIDEANADVGYIDYEKTDKKINVKHTVVTPKYRGKSYGLVLVEEFFKVYPLENYEFTSECWFFTKVLKRKGK